METTIMGYILLYIGVIKHQLASPVLLLTGCLQTSPTVRGQLSRSKLLPNGLPYKLIRRWILTWDGRKQENSVNNTRNLQDFNPACSRTVS